MRTLVTLLAAGLVLASCEHPSVEPTAAPGQVIDPGTLRQSIDPYACTGTDNTPPQIAITSPSSGSVLSGTVTLTVNATDDVGVAGVVFYLDGRMLVWDNTPPFELVWDSATHGNGPGVFTAQASDANCNHTTSAPVEVTIENAGVATYDPSWGTPACAAVGSKCDSADLLAGRGLLSPELHPPSTLGGACEDGSIGVGGPTAAVERLVVIRSDGTALAEGKEVTVQATVQATASYSYQSLDLYIASNPSNPSWTFVDTLFPPNAIGVWTLTSKYVVPAGGRHVLRGIYRGNSRQTPPSPCIPNDFSNPFTDHDDLVITVGQEADVTPPVVAITSPVEGATLERVINVSVEASDNFGVSRVELYDGATLLGTSNYSPYTYKFSWATRTVPNGLHALTARAYDLAGNASNSVAVNVLIDNDYVLPQVAFIKPVEGATLNQAVPLEASASDDRGVVRVEFHADGNLIGTSSAPPYTVNWNTRWGVANGPHVLRATAYDAGGNASPPSTVNVLVDNDFVQPQTALTAPTSGATLSGTVSLEASASDDRGIAEVFFLVDGSLIGSDTTAPYAISWDSAEISNGSHNLSTMVRDVGGNIAYGASVTVQVSNAGNARFDTNLMAPRCDSVAARCDTREMVRSRGQQAQGGEPNAPNTLGGCADGSSGSYRQSESLERIRIIREDGTPMAAGKRVRIEADVYAVSTSYDYLDLYYTANATWSPSWTYLATIKPTATGFQTLSAEYVLPAGNLQAVRAIFRAAGSLGTCAPPSSQYSYIDRDDVVFPVGAQETDTVAPDGVVLTAPAPGITVTGTLTLTASANDNFGVVSVDFLDGETLIGTDTQAPYSVSWNSRSGPNGSRTLTARARDLAGNVTTSQPVTVTAANDLTVPVVALTSPAPGSRLSRMLELTADASDPEGVTRVDFYAYDRLIGSDSSAPYTCSCDSYYTGMYPLTARAYDAAGNEGSSAPVTVTVVQELVPPSVALTAPVGGARLVGTVTLSANATDASGVNKVEFLLDGVLLATDTSSPYSYSWNTQTAANGGHLLSARARDIHGNIATSTEVSVTVDNAAPAVAITSPAGGATVSGGVSLQADATDNEGVTRVEFFVDGALLASDTTAPYSVEWDSGFWFNGSHTLLAKAYDAVGNVGTSTQLTVSTSQPGSAIHDYYYLRAPKCSTPTPICDTTATVKGRHTAESYGPNTINAACADGTASLEAQKINRIRLSSVDGENFTQGQRVRIEVHVLALDTATDALDLFYATDALNPAWTYLTTLQPGATGAQVLSTEYVLPGGKLQAVRAQFRVGGISGSACSTGALDDHDDVIFTVNTGPTVALTAPTNNALVRGTVSLTATATDDQGVARVEFYVDGTLIGTDTSSPYAASWDSTGAMDGAHSLTAKAYDAAGLATTSAVVGVLTDNTPPGAALTSPAQGALLRGAVVIEATASDSQGVTKVEFYAGATLIGTTFTAPYVAGWNTTSVTSGAHTLTVKAYDGVGNVSTSAGVGVTVDNTAPTVSISAPASNALVGGTVQISATASDSSGVEKVELYVDGALIGTDTSAPYAVSWNTATVADGAHSLTAKAFDIAGNVRTSTAVSVNTDNSVPEAALTSPVPGMFFQAGYVTLDATASDSRGVTKVEFYDGATLLGTDTSSPYALSWYTVGVGEGAHTLTAKAYDAIGNVGTSAGVTVTVDRTGPATAISAPAQNALVRGIVPVSATASDTYGVERVEFYANGTLLGTTTTAPYVVSWDTTVLADGVVTLTTKAYDLAGNVTQSASRTVTVDSIAPTVAITSPANGASAFLSTTIQASASDNRGVTQVVFYDGANVIGTDTTAPYSLSWGLLTVPKGWHTLTAKAYDAAGNVTTSAPISLKVN
ncbi:Ig-like domain-containing protein [Archangium lansingense]|uniref:Ig-like domain-containing protein n=1 Tax=Archangium lansingense TaxID=2995310 RepID=A0ABT4ABH4_9BACT|nr:Ig-like domain-containing protein [Archangium lansinium]MCY1078279.1 Ig-like domain-containing protein [Archangium lansinium]